MQCFLYFTGSGPIVVLTSHDSPTDPGLIQKLKAKGIQKFIAYEIPVALARERYGAHFDVVQKDLHESDDLRVLDYDGHHAFRLFHFAELGEAVEFESEG